jgi:hypothetical protein
VLSGENTYSAQRIGNCDGSVRLTYDGGGVSSSTSSSSSQTAESAGSSSSSAADEAGRTDRAESLVGRIGQRVDEILERVKP